MMDSNAKTRIPALFQAILDNYKDREAFPTDGTMTQAQWRHLMVLVRTMRDLKRAAEKALKWNTDKGA